MSRRSVKNDSQPTTEAAPLALWLVSETRPLDRTSKTIVIHRYAALARTEAEALAMAKDMSPFEDEPRKGERTWSVALTTTDPKRFRVILPIFSRAATPEEIAARNALLGKPRRKTAKERGWG
jgi:hypothetical protein